MRWFLTVTLVIDLVGQVNPALAYARNNRHYWVRSPAWGSEHPLREAIWWDGGVSFSEHRRGNCSHHRGVAHWA